MGCSNDNSVEVENDEKNKKYNENSSSSEEEDIKDFEEYESK